MQCDKIYSAIKTGHLENLRKTLEHISFYAYEDKLALEVGLVFCVTQCYVEMLREILRVEGLNVDYIDENVGKTALAIACSHGDTNREEVVEIVRLLIGHGANINIKDSHGRTPMMFALEYSQDKILQFLIKMRAKLLLKNNEGETVIYHAAKTGTFVQFKLLYDYSMACGYCVDSEYLLGISLSRKDKQISKFLSVICDKRNKQTKGLLRIGVGAIYMVLALTLELENNIRYCLLATTAVWALPWMKYVKNIEYNAIPVTSFELGPVREVCSATLNEADLNCGRVAHTY